MSIFDINSIVRMFIPFSVAIHPSHPAYPASRKKLTLFPRMLSFGHMSQFTAGFGFWFSGYFYPPSKTAF